MEPAVVQELLLVCSAIGSTDAVVDTEGVDKGTRFLRGDSCLEWLQDLQRAIRRDDDTTRPIAITLARWKILPEKLIPLMIGSADDLEFAITATKICVMLTSPLSTSTRAALDPFVKIKGIGRKNSPAPNKSEEELKNEASGNASSERQGNQEEVLNGKDDVEEDDIVDAGDSVYTKHGGGDEMDKGIAPEKVKNAKDQLNALQLFKKSFISQSALSALVGIVEGPLGRPDYRRTYSDSFILELVLTLLKNLICIPDHHPRSSPLGLSNPMVHMQEDLICLMSKELLLDVLRVLVGAVGQQQSSVSKLNLILLETLHSLLAPYSPKGLLRAKVSEEMATAKMNEMGGNTRRRASPAPQTGKLSAMLSKNPTLCNSGDIMCNRHARFDVSTKTASHQRGVCSRSVSAPVPQYKRKGGMAGAVAGAAVFTPVVGGSDKRASTGVQGSKAQARVAVCEFALSLLQGGYAPFMNSIKLEFQRDSHRLERGDRPKFFELGAFFMGLHRLMHKYKHAKLQSSLSEYENGENSQSAEDTYSFGQIMPTMDMMCFNMVVTECSEAIETNDNCRLQSSVTALVEMMNVLAIIAVSDDVAQYVVALGLLQRLFHNGQDSLDPLPQLLRHWAPGHFTAKYTQLLLELAHVTLKILDSQLKRNIDIKEELKGDTFKSLLSTFHEFDVEGYFCRRVANTQMVSICTWLLRLHATNSLHINYYILAMFQRFSNGSRMKSSSSGAHVNRISLEPMLYSIPVFITALDILSTRDDNLEDLSRYFRGFLHRFSSTAQSNRLAFVEVLLPHVHPTRYCKLFASHYNEHLDDVLQIQNQLSTGATTAVVKEDQYRRQEIDCAVALPKAEEDTPVSVESNVATMASGAKDDDEEEDQLDDNTAINPVSPFKRRKKQNDGNNNTGGSKRPPRWTKEEDTILLELYPKFADTSSVFTVLSAEDTLQRQGRTEDQIRRRIKKLGIQQKSMEGSSLTAIHSSSNDSDIEMSFESDDPQPQKPSPRKKKSVSRKLVKLKRKSSAALTDDEMGDGGESDEIISQNIDGCNIGSKTLPTISDDMSSSSPKDNNNRYQRRQRIIIDDDDSD